MVQAIYLTAEMEHENHLKFYTKAKDEINCVKFDFTIFLRQSCTPWKILKVFHDRIPLWQFINLSFLPMYSLPVFQIIPESWQKQYFKLFGQFSRGDLVHIHTNTQKTVDGRRVALRVRWLWRKVGFTDQFAGHHFPPVIEVRGWTLHGLLVIWIKKEMRNDVNQFPLTGGTQMEMTFGPYCLLPGHPWSH